MRTLFLTLIFFNTFILNAQLSKKVLIYDFLNERYDSIPPVIYDETIVRDKTEFNLGNYNLNTLELEQSPPIDNVFDNSQYTKKRQASLDYDIESYPIRTSIKLFTVENDTLKNLCSGNMVSDRHLITATHCLNNELHEDSILVDSLYACPIYDNGLFSNVFDCSYVSKAYFFPEWWKGRSDMAILELEESIGAQTGWLSIGFEEEDEILADGIFYKFSFPVRTIPFLDSLEYNGDTLYYNYGVVDQFLEDGIRIFNTIAVYGESGSSIIKVENDNDYTAYGTLNYAQNSSHSRITAIKYYAYQNVIKNNLQLLPINESDENVIYPNPVVSKFGFKNLLLENIREVEIHNCWGQKIYSTTKLELDYEIDVSWLIKGIYIVKVKTHDTIYVNKILKVN